jgi:CubicO group peptidase (beta-lactamase class C family)
MNRREWLRLSGASLLAGFGGCTSGTGPAVTIPSRTTRLLAGSSAYGVWQGMRSIEGNNTGSRALSFSITKSFAALAAAKAIGEGWLQADAPLTGILPEWRTDPRKSRITLRMLLNQTSGIAPSPSVLYRGSIDKGKVAPALPMVDAPGTRFRYGPASWEILGEVLHRVLQQQGGTLEKFLHRMMRRVDVSSPRWRKDAKGRYYLSTGAEFSIREMGRLGRVIGNLVSGKNDAGIDAAIFRDLSSPRAANPMYAAGIWWNRNAGRNGATAVLPERVLDGAHDPSFWNRACLSTAADPGWLALVGSGGKRVYILPTRDLVIVRMSNSYGWNDGGFLSTVSV